MLHSFKAGFKPQQFSEGKRLADTGGTTMARSKGVTKDIVSGGEMFLSVFGELLKQARGLGATDEDIRRLSRPEGVNILGRMAKHIVQGISDPMRAVVNYEASLGRLLDSCTGLHLNEAHRGREWDLVEVDEIILGPYGSLSRDFFLVRTRRQETSTSINDHMVSNDLSPVTLREALCWARTFPSLVQGHIIVLGDMELGLRRCHRKPAAHLFDGQLDLRFDSDYPPTAEYLAVRNDHPSE